jgi:predicted house-cleaning noncanonical NTP pyrophosphatase (MazG superfamily)
VGQVLSDKDYRTAVVPRAKRLEEALTRRVLHKKLAWTDIRFKFVNLDDPDVETQMDICAKMYAGNAETPNGWRKRMGMKPLQTPFAELTQVEAMMLMQEAAALVAKQQADEGMQRQQQMMEKQAALMPPGMGMPPAGPEKPPEARMVPGKGITNLPPRTLGPAGQPPAAGGPAPPPGAAGQKPAGGMPMPPAIPGGAGAGGGAPAAGKGSAYGMPPNPKRMVLPKFPIAGTVYSAAQIAKMEPDKAKDVIQKSGQKPSAILKSMDDQEPGIIEQLSDEVKEFLEQRLKEEENERKGVKPIAPQLLDKWREQLATRKGRDDRRPRELADWMKQRVNKPDPRQSGTGRPRGKGTLPGKPGTSPI